MVHDKNSPLLQVRLSPKALTAISLAALFVGYWFAFFANGILMSFPVFAGVSKQDTLALKMTYFYAEAINSGQAGLFGAVSVVTIFAVRWLLSRGMLSLKSPLVLGSLVVAFFLPLLSVLIEGRLVDPESMILFLPGLVKLVAVSGFLGGLAAYCVFAFVAYRLQQLSASHQLSEAPNEGITSSLKIPLIGVTPDRVETIRAQVGRALELSEAGHMSHNESQILIVGVSDKAFLLQTLEPILAEHNLKAGPLNDVP